MNVDDRRLVGRVVLAAVASVGTVYALDGNPSLAAVEYYAGLRVAYEALRETLRG